MFIAVRPGLVQGTAGNALSGGGADYRHAAHVLPNRVKHTGSAGVCDFRL